jgi:hypothetical protein
VFHSKSLTMAAARAIRRGHSPNGGILLLCIKPRMCSMGRCATHCIALADWQAKLSLIYLHFS